MAERKTRKRAPRKKKSPEPAEVVYDKIIIYSERLPDYRLSEAYKAIRDRDDPYYGRAVIGQGIVPQGQEPVLDPWATEGLATKGWVLHRTPLHPKAEEPEPTPEPEQPAEQPAEQEQQS